MSQVVAEIRIGAILIMAALFAAQWITIRGGKPSTGLEGTAADTISTAEKILGSIQRRWLDTQHVEQQQHPKANLTEGTKSRSLLYAKQ